MKSNRFMKDQEPSGNHEVNLTALIDVSLVLVVILLLASPLALESSILVRNSETSGRKAPVPTKIDQVEITIENETEVRVNRNPVNRAILGATLRPLIAESTTRRVVITSRPQVTHGTFVDVLDQTKLAGAGEIAIMGN